jgi:hypothetical protein
MYYNRAKSVNVYSTTDSSLWLADETDAVLAQLEALGFKTSLGRRKEKVIVGQMPVEKLAELARIGAVRFISPPRRRNRLHRPRCGESQRSSSMGMLGCAGQDHRPDPGGKPFDPIRDCPDGTGAFTAKRSVLSI